MQQHEFVPDQQEIKQQHRAQQLLDAETPEHPEAVVDQQKQQAGAGKRHLERGEQLHVGFDQHPHDRVQFAGAMLKQAQCHHRVGAA
ncbi:MAG: hypothetical protein H0V62_05895 [Gammaproteobacteria bacterium]|nr:hypothetical protein [Gammaproteobacteria bacterium]